MIVSHRAGTKGTAFWLMSLFALMIRLAQPGLVLPSSSDESRSYLDKLSVFCAGVTEPGHKPAHNPPIVTDQDDPATGGTDSRYFASIVSVLWSLAHTSSIGQIFWRFPPVRGPPGKMLYACYAQGPPDLT